MYAVIETGGKQYQVKEGDIVFIEKLDVAADENVTVFTYKPKKPSTHKKQGHRQPYTQVRIEAIKG